MAARTVAVRLQAEVAGYINGMRSAGAATRTLSSEVARTSRTNRQQMETVGIAAGAIGTGMVAAAAAAVGAAANFEQGMSNVQAATHASAKEMDLLKNAALEAGARTAFSATEAAGGIEALSKAGRSTSDILNGGLNGALDLAAAGSLAVSDAAEIAATAMTQFKLKGDQVPHVADLLAAAAGKAQGEVSDMGMALKQGGQVAAQAGLSIEETTAALAAFASAGLLGADAGTSMKSMLQALTPNSDKAAAAMSDIGFSAYDAQGSFVGLESVAQQLKTGLAGLTEEQRATTLETIFGSDAVRAASVLYDQGAAGVAKWTAEVNDAGYAQETASLKMDNLKGKWEAFKGSVETALITAGTPVLEDLSTQLESATEWVNNASASFSKLPAPVQTATTAAVGLGGAVTVLGAGMLVLLPRIVETQAALSTLGITGARARVAMAGFGKALGGLAALTAAVYGIDALAGKFTDLPVGVNKAKSTIEDFLATGKGLDDAFAGNRANVNTFGEALKRLTDKNGLVKFGDSFAGVFGMKTIRTKEAAEDLAVLDDQLSQIMQSGTVEDAAETWRQLAGAAREAGVNSIQMGQALPKSLDALEGLQHDASGAATATEDLASANAKLPAVIDPVTKSAEDQKQALEDLKDAISGVLQETFGVEEAQDQYASSLGDLSEQVKAAKKAGDDHALSLKGNSDAALANRAAIRGVVGDAGELVQAWAESGMGSDKLAAKVEQQKKKLYDTLIQMGFNKTEAKRYADSLDDIKAQVKTTVTTPGLKAAITDISTLASRISALTGKKISVDVAYSMLKQEQAQANRGANNGVRRATGGAVFGAGTETSDSIPALLSNNEHVWTAREVRNAGGHSAVESMRAKFRFAAGGPVTVDTDSHGSAAAMSGIASALMSGANKFFQDAGGNVLAWARSQVGKPYIWGGVGPGGYDCSGFMSALANVARGRSPHQRLFSTASFAGGGGAGGFVPGANGNFAIGVMQGNPGHMAGTLHGTNVESRGGQGVVVGPSARGAGNGLFSNQFHLAGYAKGGPVGDAAFDNLSPRGMAFNPALLLKHLARTDKMLLRDSGGPVPHGYAALNLSGRTEYMMDPDMTQRFANGGAVTAPVGGFYSDYMSQFSKTFASNEDVQAAKRERLEQQHERNQARRELERATQARERAYRDEKSTAAERKAALQAEREAVAKLRAEQNDLNKARANVVSTSAKYARSQQFLTNFRSGLKMGVRNGSRFVANLEKLAKRGYGVLAQNLAQMNNEEAERIAAQAASGSNKALQEITRNIAQAAANDARLDAIANPGAVGASSSPVMVGVGSMPSYGTTDRVSTNRTLAPVFRIYLGDTPIDNLIRVQIDGMGQSMASSYAYEAPH